MGRCGGEVPIWMPSQRGIVQQSPPFQPKTARKKANLVMRRPLAQSLGRHGERPAPPGVKGKTLS
jgi:hypothetical protein